jgi:hypothetical protein
VRYPEAIALAIAIAAALGGWASIERDADPEKVCAQQLMPGVDDRWQVAGVAFPGYRGCLFPH